MRSSYNKNDVEILLKDITGMVAPQNTEERERLIQSGKHYSEMLPVEYIPTSEYMEAYEDALLRYSAVTAKAVGILADKIVEEKGNGVVLVSLARAGIPIGILVKRYIKRKYKADVKHYSVSIIRGRGIDRNAMEYILSRHSAQDIQFVDGWIGKGAILKELKGELKDFDGVSAELAVAADPANVTRLCGTHEDILIPSSCLNSTVSGLISRTFLREDIIGKNDFHGAVYYEEYKESDLSNAFLEAIESKFIYDGNDGEEPLAGSPGIDEVCEIMARYNVEDINFIKPGIGEATRVLLRRAPWRILINERDKENPMLQHLIKLAEEKGVAIDYYPLHNYKACGIIKKLADI